MLPVFGTFSVQAFKILIYFDKDLLLTGWKAEIEKLKNQTVTFIPVPTDKDDNKVIDHADKAKNYISSSDVCEMNLICHNKGGQTCTRTLNSLGDDRLNEAYFYDPSAGENKKPGVMDTVDDINNLFAANNVYLIVSVE